ncbi:hypothetical protein PsorP6_000770 [Peronosclerospora sorghi]|uniref:Uncharacterized protein n=1 Tax=Peronosclerospora sorghi TaxID=230839 RepID=A0ACC0WTR1_9STRA|nr:hypothetical protein PsorP6_000770 [Peronosclerospora sorghi]
MNTNVKRLRKELQELKKHPEEDMVLYPEGDTIMHWKAFIRGPQDTPFEGRCFELAIQTTSLYPMEPPKMKFRTKIFHPNVHFKVIESVVVRPRNRVVTLSCYHLPGRQHLSRYSQARVQTRPLIATLVNQTESIAPRFINFSNLMVSTGNMIRAGDMLAYNTMAEMYKIEFGLLELPQDPF